MLFRRKVDSWQKNIMDEIPVLTVHQAGSACAPQTNLADVEFIKEPKSPFLSIISDVCTVKSITDNEPVEIPTLVKFILV